MGSLFDNFDAAFLGILPGGVKPGTMSWSYYGQELTHSAAQQYNDTVQAIGAEAAGSAQATVDAALAPLKKILPVLAIGVGLYLFGPALARSARSLRK